MIDPTAIPPDPQPPPQPPPVDLTDEVFQFYTTIWIESPRLLTNENDTNEETYRRNANDSVYQQLGTATNWHRYITLGYYAIDDGKKFDSEWKNIGTNPLTLHRMIWYNYLYHVDHDMDIPTKLQAWAIQVSQPYLVIHDPESLTMNTTDKKWTDINFNGNPKTTTTDNQGEWIPVSPPRGHRNRSPPPLPPQTSNPQNSGMSMAPEFNLPEEERYRYRPRPPSPPRPPTTITEENASVTVSEGNTNQSMDEEIQSYSNESEFSRIIPEGPRPPALANISTNDGTHRVTIKWTPDPAEDATTQTIEHNKDQMDKALFKVLSLMFSDEDGEFYRWESEDMTESRTISQMDSKTVRDFTTPVITTIHSRNQVIFGVRFCFNTNPIRWKNEGTIAGLKEANLSVTVSNSISTSGKLVIAGYILLKAPNSTHRHRYIQHLLRHLPDATPYFDIVRLSKTPLEQPIPHLAVQCGEKHVTPLCQALLKYLTGQNKALFLPRYALGTMTEKQIAQHFEFHQKWARSLSPISLFPTVSHIDQPRREYFPDGTIVVRSAREWVATLTLKDGVTPALCDIVNGTKNRHTNLATPRHFLADAKLHWQQYKTRLYPPSRREARFRDSLPGLPNEIQISTDVQSNVAFLLKMSSAEIWHTAPASVRGNSTNNSSHRSASAPSRRNRQQDGHTHRSDNSSIGSIAESNEENPRPDDQIPGDSDFPPLSNVARAAVQDDDERSNASTQSLTRGSMTTTQARFRELDAILRRQQKTLDSQAKQASDRLTSIERQLYRIDALDKKMDDMKIHSDQAAKNQTAMTTSLRDDIRIQTEAMKTDTKMYQEQCDTNLAHLSHQVVNAMEEIIKMRTDLAKLTSMMMKDLTTRPSPAPKRRKQRQLTQEEIDAMIDNHNHDINSDDEMADLSDKDFPDGKKSLYDLFSQEDDVVMHAANYPLPTTPKGSPLTNPRPPQHFNEDDDRKLPAVPQAPLDLRNNKTPGSDGAEPS